MKTLFYISLKYWRKHLKTAFALLFAGILMNMVVTVSLLMLRSSFARQLHSDYDYDGMYELIVTSPSQEFLTEISGGREYSEGHINILGKTGTGAEKFTCGYLDDPAGLCHIPMESGRLPQSENEIAADRYVLDRFGWVGDVGDTLTLDGVSYTVSGIIDEIYGLYRPLSEISSTTRKGMTDPPEQPLPSIFVGKPENANVLYEYTMLSGIAEGNLYGEDDLYIKYDEILQKYGYSSVSIDDLYSTSELLKKYATQDTAFLLCLSIVCMVIAALSVFSVLRSVIAQRKNHDRLLLRIGLSRKRLAAMYCTEGLFAVLVQLVIGCGAGSLVYMAIYIFQTELMGMPPYSGFTADKWVTNYTLDPFIISAAFSVIMTVTAFLAGALASKLRPLTKKRGKKPASLFVSIGRVFRQRYITVVQTAALVLICCGTALGYMYFADTPEKESFYHENIIQTLNYTPQSYEFSTEVGGIDLELDGISEYYSAPGSPTVYIGEFPMAGADTEYGIDDAVADELKGAQAFGVLTNTFMIGKEGYPDRIFFGTQEEKDYLISVSDEKYADIFDDGELGALTLDKIEVSLADSSVIDSLDKYVISGSIDPEKISNGEEVIFVCSGSGHLSQGDEITLCSAKANDYGGIGEINSGKVKIGAVISTENMDNVTFNCVKNYQSEVSYGLLTTVSGAKAIGLHNAAYTNIIAKDGIDAGPLTGAGFTKTGLAQIHTAMIASAAAKYGGMALIIIIMSLLGFAAYFNGIGVKIRQRAYEISVLRAVGAPISRLRLRLLIDNIKLPIIAGALSVISVKGLQMLMAHGYYLHSQTFDMLNDPSTDRALKESLRSQLTEISDRYFLDRVMWVVPAERITLIIVGIMCAVTILLTVLALRKFRKNIAEDINSGRERQ